MPFRNCPNQKSPGLSVSLLLLDFFSAYWWRARSGSILKSEINLINRCACTNELCKLGDTFSVTQEYPSCMNCFTSVWPDPSHNRTLVGNLERHISECSDSTWLGSWLYFLITPVCNRAEDKPPTVLLVQCSSSSSSLNYWRAALGSVAPLSCTPR